MPNTRRIVATQSPDRETDRRFIARGVQTTTRCRTSPTIGHAVRLAEVRAKLNALTQVIDQMDGVQISCIRVSFRTREYVPSSSRRLARFQSSSSSKIIDPLGQSNGTRGKCIQLLPRGDSFDTGLRIFGQANDDRLGARRIATGLDVLMKRLRVFAVPGARRRRGRGNHGIDGRAGAAGAAGECTPDFPRYDTARHRARRFVRRSRRRPHYRPTKRPPTCKCKIHEPSTYALLGEMATRPQTLYGFADSPVALAAWLIDHGDGWGQPAPPILSAILGQTVDGHPSGAVTRDDVLDNITLYWLTNTGVSAARFYWENARGGLPPLNAVNVSIPAAVSIFPGEIYTLHGVGRNEPFTN